MTVPTPIYHATHVANLPGVIISGGLVCCSALRGAKIAYRDVANQGIQGERRRKLVPLGPGGCLHDYVPFFFAPKSPMLFAISKNQGGRYPDGQRAMIHLRLTAQAASRHCGACVFTDGHAIMELSKFYEDLRHLDRIDWKVMASTMWTDTEEFPGRKRLRQAEFLIYGRLAWELVEEIGVMDGQMQADVLDQLQNVAHRPVVSVRRGWFY